MHADMFYHGAIFLDDQLYPLDFALSRGGGGTLEYSSFFEWGKELHESSQPRSKFDAWYKFLVGDFP